MPRGVRGSSKLAAPRVVNTTKYDAHHKVLKNTYGTFADLRRELADSREQVAERESVLAQLAACADPQRAYLLFDDYLEKLDLRRSDFGRHALPPVQPFPPHRARAPCQLRALRRGRAVREGVGPRGRA